MLHSHVQKYPDGSEQQQVTCYAHKDSNNNWMIERAWGVEAPESPDVVFVKDGDIVRLVHAGTKKSLHSHNLPAPLSKDELEVSCYGNETFGDINDHWQIERVMDLTGKSTDRIRSLSTQFRLRHVQSGCLLRADRVTLPQWGFKQEEVVCQKKPNNDSTSNYWNIENHVNSKCNFHIYQVPPGGKEMYRSSFIRDFIDLNIGMWTSNNALTPDGDKEPEPLTSMPYHWPFLLRTLRMCGWGDSDIKYLLVGNPFIWWSSTASLLILSFTFIIYNIRQKRGHNDFTPSNFCLT